jgi:transcriptional regulator with XRE-family HTH domain
MDTLRLRFCLSQKELARLVGKGSHSAISRYEAGESMPPLDVLIAYEVTFGACLRDLFPDRYATAEDTIVATASAFWDELDGKSDHESNRKRALLLDVIKRAEAKAPDA